MYRVWSLSHVEPPFHYRHRADCRRLFVSRSTLLHKMSEDAEYIQNTCPPTLQVCKLPGLSGNGDKWWQGNLCEIGSTERPQLWTLPLYVVRLNAEEDDTNEVVGQLVVWQAKSRELFATVVLQRPWMMWSVGSEDQVRRIHACLRACVHVFVCMCGGMCAPLPMLLISACWEKCTDRKRQYVSFPSLRLLASSSA
jgi:hypothetical protein